MNMQLKSAIVALGLLLMGGANAQAQDPIKIGFLMPCTQCSDRWEQKDRPFFIDAIKAIDPSIEVIASNAQGDQNKLISQAEAALAQGAKVLVVNTIQENGAVPIVEAAHREGATVIAYDALIRGAVPDGYISFNNEEVGRLQAQFVVDNVPNGGNVVLINGEQFCDACRAFKRGAHEVLDEAAKTGRIKLIFEGEAKGWLPANATALMEQALTLANNDVAGVVAANDGLAQGVIAALTNVSLNGKVVVTGQDATDAALTNILAGDQTMTVYKALQAQAGAADKAAVALAKGEDVAGIFPDKVNNEVGDVASLLLKPGVVTAANIPETVIADGYAQKDKICVGAAADKCNFWMAAPSNEPLLEVRGVKKRFGSVEALQGTDLTVHAAEVVALLGDNGAGKSTLIKTIAGVYRPDEGEIVFEGKPVIINSPGAATALGIETVYQDLSLCDNLTVVQNLFLGRERRLFDSGPLSWMPARRQMLRQADDVVKQLGTTLPSLTSQIGTMSGGQRQAVAVARAMVWGSKLVILDEPTAALGVEQTANVHRVIRRLKESGVGVILITHSMPDVFALADRIVVMRQGRNIAEMIPTAVTSDDVVSAITGGSTLKAVH